MRHLGIYLPPAAQIRYGTASRLNMSNMSEGREQNLFDLYDQNSGLVHQFEARSESIFVKHNGGWVDFVCDGE